MTKINSLMEVLLEELKDIYNAEHQILGALPKMVKKATSPALKEALKMHLEETEVQVERLDEISKILKVKLTGKKCKGTEGLIEEGKEVLELESDNPALIDTLLIGAAQRIEHYEMAAYGGAKAVAEELGLDSVVMLLQETLDEEKAADAKLSEISQEEVLAEASVGAGSQPKTKKSGRNQVDAN